MAEEQIKKPEYLTTYARIVRVMLPGDKLQRFPLPRYGVLFPVTGNIWMGANGEGFSSTAMAVRNALDSGCAVIQEWTHEP